tara:strand:+ start:2216 stop:2875 length:660 start_codon:yes stop_codon:yes gene_type:complete
MLISYSNNFNVKALKRLCKIKGIKFINERKKDELLNLLKKFNAAKIIQKKLRQKTIIDFICPVCHEPLKYPFVSIKVRQKFFYYDFYTLIEYLNKTQDFRDPCTRYIISDTKLIQINKMIRYYYGKTTNKILISKSMIKNTDLHIITYCLHDIVKEIENRELSIEETYNNILPRFIYYTNYLIKNHSEEDSNIILKACKESLTNHIIIDYINLIEMMNS